MPCLLGLCTLISQQRDALILTNMLSAGCALSRGKPNLYISVDSSLLALLVAWRGRLQIWDRVACTPRVTQPPFGCRCTTQQPLLCVCGSVSFARRTMECRCRLGCPRWRNVGAVLEEYVGFDVAFFGSMLAPRPWVLYGVSCVCNVTSLRTTSYY